MKRLFDDLLRILEEMKTGDSPDQAVHELEECMVWGYNNCGWQPIETAPRDATVVDLWRGEWKYRACNMVRVDMGKGNVFYDPVSDGPSCVRDATHWMLAPGEPEE